MKDYYHGHRLNKRQHTTTRTSLILLLLLTTMMIATVITTTMQTTQSAPQQNTNQGNPIREGAPPTATYWAKTYGGGGEDVASSVQQTADGGYIVAGDTYSFGAGAADVWVLKLDSTGLIDWQKTYGGGSDDEASSVQQTPDGGYIVAGDTGSFGAGAYDVWVLKLDSTGGVTWQKTYGGTDYDGAFSVQQTSDGGYIVAGYTYSFGAGAADVWVLKLDSTGLIDWQKTYGGGSDDYASSVQQTLDGGYIVAGATVSFGVGGDFWVLKLDSSGGVTWQKTYGGTGGDVPSSVQQTSDGGYIVAGTTGSFGAGLYDVWVLKLDSSGGVTWQKTYGGSGYDYANSVQQTADGGYTVAGDTNSFGAAAVWVLKLDSSGSVTWQKTYGGTSYDSAYSVQQTSDGGYIAAGYTNSFGAGGYDFWVLKLDSTGSVVWDAGIGAETQTTSVTPSDSSATTSTTAVTPANSAATVQNTLMTPQDTNATVAVQSTPDTTPPATIVDLVAGSPTSGSITLTWTAPGDDGTLGTATGYVVKYSTTAPITALNWASATTYPQSWTPLSAGNGELHVVSGLMPGATYWFAVEAYDKVPNYGGVSNSPVAVTLVLPRYWAIAYGGSSEDYGYSVRQTADGGYIVAGLTNSFGVYDVWVLKLNSTGSVEWQKTYGGSGLDCALSVQQTSDGGYIVAGYTTSFGAGTQDSWILKLNSTGSVEWQKTYGGSGTDYARSVQQTSDGGYIAAGYTNSFGAGGYDFWVLKLDSGGEVTWQKTYGGTSYDLGYSVQQTSDGGYIVAGETVSFGAGGYDFWVLKLNSTGSVEWQKTYGGTNADYARSVQQTADGGYIVAGYTYYSFGTVKFDVWVLKLDSSGSVTWQKTYGGAGDDAALSVQQTSSDGGYIVAGYTSSFGAGMADVWVLKLDSSGSVTWQKTYGGTGYDYAYSVQQTADGGYIVAGYTDSFGAGRDVWVVKLGVGGDIVWDAGSGASTLTTSVVPSDSSATVSATSAALGSSAATVQDTLVMPQDTSATVTVQSPPPAPVIDQPSDVTYTVGQTGNSITWHPSSQIPSMYCITRNGTIVASGSWSGTPITQNVDGLSAGRYIYTCTVKDTLSRSTNSSVQVLVVLEPAPTIDQPSDVTYTVGQTGNSITWHPTSTIPDHYTISVNGGSPTSYSWNGGSITQSVDGISLGTYAYNCSVYDIFGRRASSVVQVTVLPPPPTIDQPSAVTYTVGQTGNSITWTPSSQIPDHYTISVNGGPATSYSWNGQAITYNVDGLSVGTYTYNCTVYDTLGRKASSIVLVTVLPPAPTIDQPATVTYTVGQTGNSITWYPTSQIPDHYTISVNGGSPTSHSWDGSAITLSVDGLSAGTYTYNCTVYDTQGRSATSKVQVTVLPPAPTIDQPSNITYTVGHTGNNITWHPSSQIPSKYSITRNGTIVSSGSWSGASITQSVDGLSAGTYIYRCTVNDTLGRSASSSVQVLVILPPVPTIDQLSAITYVAGTTGNTITWHPSSEIPDHYTISVNGSSPTSHSWNGSAITFNVDGLLVGTHIVNCTVYDTRGRSASSTVTVTVSAPAAQGIPVIIIAGAVAVAAIVLVILIVIITKRKK